MSAWQPLVRVELDPATAGRRWGHVESSGLVWEVSHERWSNDLYDVHVRRLPDGPGFAALDHLAIKRHDRAAARDWRHFQQIKNEVCGPEREAIEIFPRESRLVDLANHFHLWVLPEGVDLLVGFDHGHADVAYVGRAQRPYQDGLTTGSVPSESQLLVDPGRFP